MLWRVCALARRATHIEHNTSTPRHPVAGHCMQRAVFRAFRPRALLLRHAGSTGSAARPCCGVRVAVGHAAPIAPPTLPLAAGPTSRPPEQRPPQWRAVRCVQGGLFVVSTVICHFSHADPRFPWEGVRSDGDEVPLIFLKQRRSECQSSHFQGSPWVPCHWPWEAVACDAKAQRMFALQAQTELSLCEIS